MVFNAIHYTRDITRLGQTVELRNQKLNNLYTLSDSDFTGCCDTARSTINFLKCNSDECRSNFIVLGLSDNSSTLHR